MTSFISLKLLLKNSFSFFLPLQPFAQMCTIRLAAKQAAVITLFLSVIPFGVGSSASDATISFTASSLPHCGPEKNNSSCNDGAEIAQSSVNIVAHPDAQEIPPELRNVLLYAQNLVHERTRAPRGEEESAKSRRSLLSTDSELATPGCGEFYGLGEQVCSITRTLCRLRYSC